MLCMRHPCSSRASSRDDPEVGVGSGVPRRRLVTAGSVTTVERREAPPPYVTGGRAPSQRRAAGRVMVRQGALAKRPAPPGAPFPSSAREKEKGKGRRPAPENSSARAAKRWLFDIVRREHIGRTNPTAKEGGAFWPNKPNWQETAEQTQRPKTQRRPNGRLGLAKLALCPSLLSRFAVSGQTSRAPGTAQILPAPQLYAAVPLSQGCGSGTSTERRARHSRCFASASLPLVPMPGHRPDFLPIDADDT